MYSQSRTEVRSYGHYIAGKQVPSAEGALIQRFNPATAALVAEWPSGSAEDVDQAVDAAYAAWKDRRWSTETGGQRSAVLLRVAELLNARAEELAAIETQETGKPLRQSLEEVSWIADLWYYAAGLARGLHGDSHGNLGSDRLAIALREPIGVVGIITPWNYPLLSLSQKAACALAAGCAVVVKPSELTSGTSLVLGQILDEAGLPPGVFNVVTGVGPVVGQRIAEHPDVNMISFTGSTAVGKAITRAAAGNMKKVVMELGGKNPSIVFADADLEAAADGVVKGITYNTGQECGSSSRLLVQASAANALITKIAARMAAITVGDPLDPASQLGPLISEKHFAKVASYIEEGKRTATLVTGGLSESLPGLFVRPTLFSDVAPEMKIAREEIFGPVLSVLTFKTTDDAVELANDTVYGLTAAIWTRSLDTAVDMARAVRAGMVWVNTVLDTPTDVPFGGVKESGIGRENGLYAAEEYTVMKSIVIKTTGLGRSLAAT